MAQHRNAIRGSSKDIEIVSEGELKWTFTDRASAFDVGPMPQKIPGKGKAVCACAVQSWRIAEALGIPTCFIRQLNPRSVLVKRFNVVTDRTLTAADRPYVVPAEFIDRAYFAGSARRRVVACELCPQDFGFPSSEIPPEGTALPYPQNETTTKFERVDRDLSEAELLALAGLSAESLRHIWAMINRLNGALSLAFHQAGFTRFDGKKEIGIDAKGSFVVVDTFGTPDEDRPALQSALRSGGDPVRMHYGKERLRQYLISVGFYDEVKQARSRGLPDPPYPRLPPHVIREVAIGYESFAERYSAVAI